MPDWYEQIEEPVRELVRLLRNNGFNTVCSCGHEMYVQMQWNTETEEGRNLYSLLIEHGYKDFELHFYWCSDGIGRFMEVRILDKRNT